MVNEHRGAFVGLKVIELGRFIAAPYCAQLLADSGADVIKIEPLEGDQTRRNGTITVSYTHLTLPTIYSV